MQPAMLVCAPTSQASISGAKGRWCHVCSAAVWVSPSMLPSVDGGSALPTCQDCASGLVALTGTAVIHPNQVEELRRTGLLGIARRFVEDVNRRADPRRGSSR